MGYCLPLESEMPSNMQSDYNKLMNAFALNTGGSLVMDIYIARWYILMAMGFTLVYTLIYIKFMDWCAFGIAWFSIVAVGVSMVIGGLAFYYDAQEKESPEGSSYAFWLNFSAWCLWASAGFYCLCIALNFKSL